MKEFRSAKKRVEISVGESIRILRDYIRAMDDGRHAK